MIDYKGNRISIGDTVSSITGITAEVIRIVELLSVNEIELKLNSGEEFTLTEKEFTKYSLWKLDGKRKNI